MPPLIPATKIASKELLPLAMATDKVQSKSSRSYSDRTLKQLWGRAAGRCALPNCRVELLVDATDFDPVVVIGDIAHIEASSSSGPRANTSKSRKERDEYENLILLCKNCHARIDGQKKSNSVEYIRALRNDHEAWVRASLPERGQSTTGWKLVLLQGPHSFDQNQIISALQPDFPDDGPVIIEAQPEKEAWDAIGQRIKAQANDLLASVDPFEFRAAIFPLAPVSAGLALGYYLTSRPNTRLFQHHRDERSWTWSDQTPPLEDISVQGMPSSVQAQNGEVAICFDLSASVTATSVQETGVAFVGQIHVAVPTPGSDWLIHPEQLKQLARKARNVFEECLSAYPHASKWHVFFAGPAPAAVTVGQQLNPTMCPPIQLYEFRRDRVPAYKPSIQLRGDDL